MSHHWVMAEATASGGWEPAVAETHSGVVFFFGDRAYKVKKPVDLGFLDFRELSAREAVCHREVELNRRLAPDVYLGVADLVDPDGEICEHMVVMRRMPTDRRLSKLVGDPDLDVGEDLDALAELIARFHHGAERSPEVDQAAGAEALSTRWKANTAEMMQFAGRCFDRDDVTSVDALAARYLAGRGPLFAERVDAGRACDGHGDLQADDIFLLEDGPRVLDCLEFDDALRFDDALADAAFLAMDLERLGRADLGSRFLAAYRRASGDSWPTSLAHHHIAYRAQVRAKVTAIRAEQGAADAPDQARDLLALARRHLEAGAVRLIAVGGLPGTGKSTLAAGLADALDAVLLRSDVIRKEQAGLGQQESAASPFGEGLYREEAKEAVYIEMLTRAKAALGGGETVVLDAAWTDEDRRRRYRRLADDTVADLVELRCVLPREVAADRMRARAERGDDASDADPSIARSMERADDPWPTAIEIDTTASPREVTRHTLNSLPAPVRDRPDVRSRD